VRRADDRGNPEKTLERALEFVDALSRGQEERVENGRDRPLLVLAERVPVEVDGHVSAPRAL